jgi:hypothetical protein
LSRFLLKLILVALLSATLYFLAGLYLPAQWHYTSFSWIPVLFAVTTYLFHQGLSQRSNDSKKFVRFYMGATAARLFFYLTVIIIFALLNRSQATVFALSFFFFYLCFTVFEVAESYRLGRKV